MAKNLLVRKYFVQILVCNIYQNEIGKKIRCQYHQHFTRAFFYKILATKITKLNCSLCNFWRQNIGTKAVYKMWMKLTTVVNFINILLTNFSYKRCFGSFFLVTCTYKNDVRTKNSPVLRWWNWYLEKARVLQRFVFYLFSSAKWVIRKSLNPWNSWH